VTYQDPRVTRAIKLLGRSGSVREAALSLQTTPAALRALFERAREKGLKCGSPVDHVSTGRERQSRAQQRAAGRLPSTRRFVAEPESAIERVIICPDVHVPYHDERAWNVFLNACRAWKPDTLVCLGDFLDCYSISEFTKDPARQLSFADEIGAGVKACNQLQAAFAGPVKFLGGNHEYRLDKHIAKNAPELHGVTSIPDLLEFERRPGWQWIPYGEQLQIGHIRFCHDYGAAGSRSVSQSLAATGHCVVFGHTHRAAIEYSGTTDGERHVGMTCGWLGDYDALAFSYAKRWKARREWTHGFSTATIERATGLGWVQFHPIIDGRVILDSQVIH